MNNLCNENFILILIFVLFAYLLFQINNVKNTSENFGNALNDTALITIEVINQISNIYQADVQAIRNLSAIAKGLTTGNNTVIPGAITISGQLTTDNATISNLTVTGNINGLNLQTMNTTMQSLSEMQNRITAILNNQSSQQIINSQTSVAANLQASQLAKAQASQLAASQLVANSQATNIANSQAAVTANLQNNLSLQVGQNYNLQGALTSQIVKDTNIINSETVRNSNEAKIMNSQGLQISAQQSAINSQLGQNYNLQGALNSQIVKDTNIINSETVRNLNEANIMNSQGILISGQQGIIASDGILNNSLQQTINLQASKNVQINTYTQFINIINNVRPWGMYSADTWDNNTLYDITGNGRNATTRNVNSGTGSGFGASASIPYLSGTVDSSIMWPAGSIPSTFTIAAITRYTTGTNKARILSNIESTGGNTIIGHHGGVVGRFFFIGDATNPNGIPNPPGLSGTNTYWVASVSTNSTTINAPDNVIVNGNSIGVKNGGTGGFQLGINLYATEKSDFAFTQLIIWDQALTLAQIRIVSDSLNKMLTDGITLQNLASKFNYQGVINSEIAQINSQQNIINSQASLSASDPKNILAQFNTNNIYIVPFAFGNRVNLLPNTNVISGPNNILAFSINWTGTKIGEWMQIIGITANADGSDYRYLSVWICPSSDTLHIRTYTKSNGNEAASDNDCAVPLTVGKNTIYIIGNTQNNKQYFTVYYNGIVKTSRREIDIQNNSNIPLYIYSTYGYRHTSSPDMNSIVYDIAFITSNNNFDETRTKNILDSYYQSIQIAKTNILAPLNTNNIYIVPFVYGNRVNLLPNTNVISGPNNILAFSINWSGTTVNEWMQIIGITGTAGGEDGYRYLPIWICPGSNTLHIRTYTKTNSNESAADSDCAIPLIIGKNTLYIIGNTQNNKQYFTIYHNGIIKTTRREIELQNNSNMPIYIYSTCGSRHTSSPDMNSNVYNLLFITSNNNFDETRTKNILDSYYK